MRTDINISLQYFCIVAQLKSFTKAAQQLNLSPSALSQAIQQLENRLDLKLLHRSTRSISLTEAGQQLYSRIQPTLDEIQYAIEEVKQKHRIPSGTIRVMTSYIAWKALLYPLLNDFTDKYPSIGLDIQINDGLSDIVMEGYDIGIRSSRTLSQSMIAIPLGSPIKSCVVANPQYLNSCGIPTKPEDIYQHSCIGYRFITSQQLYPWQFSKDNQQIILHPNHQFIVNNEAALIQLAIAGKGLAYVFEEATITEAIQNELLVKVLTDWQTSDTQYYLYYPNRKFLPARLRAFINFFKTIN
ncbi:LysR family transcriptional regulator [Entomomonas sp. E2T0]|uniref:LysR family transcriptional regulator n=1 Tax=Entomomonas sp. E2T0 TaxID=2930213 RepID=UPI002228310D|nr:LysR family transcriptional regulator [Entomomonas sp. E2T0]UYZ84540.1 LysR family transcriptional regulator [Entomomonas sp. E2T0]